MEQVREARLLVLGGVEAVAYKEIMPDVRISHYPHNKRFKNSRVDSYDAVVCLVNHMSHPTMKSVKQVCRKHGIPIYYLESSSGTRFKCELEKICGKLCPMRAAECGTG